MGGRIKDVRISSQSGTTCSGGKASTKIHYAGCSQMLRTVQIIDYRAHFQELVFYASLH